MTMIATDPLSKQRAYFDSVYRVTDPYGTRGRWYELRKRQLLLDVLPRPRFGRAFEPACGTGELTRALSRRCAQVLASDFCDAALAQARARVQGLANVTLHRHALPDEWPGPRERFDLIVVSEVCSFLTSEQVRAVAGLCAGSLDGDGVIAVCDWRWPFPARALAAHEAHAIFDGAGLHRQVRHEEADFLLGVWSKRTESVAQRESIV